MLDFNPLCAVWRDQIKRNYRQLVYVRNGMIEQKGQETEYRRLNLVRLNQVLDELDVVIRDLDKYCQ